jgi:hypothetical protein
MVNVNVCIVVVNHHDSAICRVELDILDLIACLRSLMAWFLVFLRLHNHLVGHVATMIDRVRSDISGALGLQLLLSDGHTVLAWTLLVIL